MALLYLFGKYRNCYVPNVLLCCDSRVHIVSRGTRKARLSGLVLLLIRFFFFCQSKITFTGWRVELNCVNADKMYKRQVRLLFVL